MRSGIVAFRLEGEAPTRTAERLLTRGFCVATTATAVRVSPHCYTQLEEIDTLLAAL
jgi:selenocysteine lyase/cysteine desulfurase